MGHDRVNAYYPLVGLELSGALKFKRVWRVVRYSVVFVVLGGIGSIIFSCFASLSAESRVPDAPQRRRRCSSCGVMAASSYCTERRARFR